MYELDLILFIIANTIWLIIAIAQAQIIKNQKEMESLNDSLINAQRRAIEAYKKSVNVKDEYIELLEKALEGKNERYHLQNHTADRRHQRRKRRLGNRIKRRQLERSRVQVRHPALEQ